MQRQVWRFWVYACLNCPASSWSSEDAVMHFVFTSETVPRTQDLLPRSWIFFFLQSHARAQSLRLNAQYVQHKKPEKDVQVETPSLHLFFHIKVGAGAVFSGCKSVSPSHPHSYVFPTRAERFPSFRHGRYSQLCWYCSIDSTLS